MPQRLDVLADQLVLLLARHRPGPAAGRLQGEDDVLPHGQVRDEPLGLAVLRAEGDLVGHRGPGRAQRRRARRRCATWPVPGVVGAEQQPGDLGTAGAQQSGQADDLALVDGRGERLDGAGAPELARLHQRPVERPLRLRPSQLAPGPSSSWPIILADQLDLAELAGQVLADQPAVAQDRHPVGDLVDLVEEVRDEQDRDALVLEPPHHPEELLDLVGVQAGGRLVQDQHLGVDVHARGRWRPSAGWPASRTTAARRRRCRAPAGRAAPLALARIRFQSMRPRRRGSRPMKMFSATDRFAQRLTSW